LEDSPARGEEALGQFCTPAQQLDQFRVLAGNVSYILAERLEAHAYGNGRRYRR